MANPEGPGDENDEATRPQARRDWATIKARARIACDRLQEQMESVRVELAQPGHSEELWLALWTYPDLWTEAAAYEGEARSVYDHLVLDLHGLDNDIQTLDAQLFLYYEREMAAAGGGNVTGPTVDAIKAAVMVDERHRAIVQRREALVDQVQEAKGVLEQLTVTRAAIEQHGESLLRLSANRRAEMDARSGVAQDVPPAGPDRSREARTYLGADSLPQFRSYLRLLRWFVRMEERAYELERLDGRDEIVELRQNLARDAATMFEKLPPGTLFGDLLLVAAPLISYEDADARVRQFVNRFLVEKGPLAEHVAAFKREIARARVPRLGGWPGDDARLAAADRIVEGIGRAIHPYRWHLVKPVLDELAELHGTARHAPQGKKPDAELRDALLSALFEGVEVVGEYTLAEEEGVRRKLRAMLNDLATTGLLGPGWRHPTEGTDIPFDEEEAAERIDKKKSRPEAAEAEARLDLERLVAAAGLSPREREVVEILKTRGLEHGDIAAAAKQLGIKEDTARVLWFRARKKLLAATRQ